MVFIVKTSDKKTVDTMAIINNCFFGFCLVKVKEIIEEKLVKKLKKYKLEIHNNCS